MSLGYIVREIFLSFTDELARKQKEAKEFHYTAKNCLDFLHKTSNFPSIIKSLIYDKNSKIDVEKNCISYELNRQDSWLENPPVNSYRTNLLGDKAESVGLWNEGLNRPAADRYFNPKNQEHKEQSAFMTGLPCKAKCKQENDFIESPCLVKTAGSSKEVSLPVHLFNVPSIKCSIAGGKTPLWAIADNHCRKSLRASASTRQINLDLRDRIKFFMDNWEEFVDLEGEASDKQLKDLFTPDLILQELSSVRCVSELTIIGCESTMNLTSASIAACRDAGRNSVLDKAQPGAETTKSELKNSGYAFPGLFGPVSDSLCTKIGRDGALASKDVVNFKPNNPGQGSGPSGSGSTKRARPLIVNPRPAKVQKLSTAPFLGNNHQNDRQQGQRGGRGRGGNSRPKNKGRGNKRGGK